MRQLIAALLLLAPPVAAQETAAMLQRAAPSVVQIIAQGCAGEAPQRSGSGFVWESADRVVTALHVVGGCRRITVNYQGIGEREAVLERSLVARDLALLRVATPPPVPALSGSAAAPAPNEPVWVYGYGGGRATREDRQLRVTDANRETPLLTHAVDVAVRGELQRLGSPLLDTEVLRVEGFLVPGDSGAPVLDRAGRVVAVGSGGLQRGTIGAGWAVRARYLTDLSRSTDRTPGPGATGGGALFALVDPSVAAEVRCGTLAFRRTRRLTLPALAESSDDRIGLEQIAQSFGTTTAAQFGLRFDLWTEPRSGAAVAVPEGLTITPGPTGCSVPMPGPPGLLELRWTGFALRVPGLGPHAEAQMASQAFQQVWAQEFMPWLALNPSGSYPEVRTSAGGNYRRMFWMGQRPGQAPHAAFETHLAHPVAYVGVVAINRAWNTPQARTPDFARSWLVASLATHLSTLSR